MSTDKKIIYNFLNSNYQIELCHIQDSLFSIKINYKGNLYLDFYSLLVYLTNFSEENIRVIIPRVGDMVLLNFFKIGEVVIDLNRELFMLRSEILQDDGWYIKKTYAHKVNTNTINHCGFRTRSELAIVDLTSPFYKLEDLYKFKGNYPDEVYIHAYQFI